MKVVFWERVNWKFFPEEKWDGWYWSAYLCYVFLLFIYYNNIIFPCAVGCGEVLEGLQGTFTSPGYPNSYANSLSCEWTISVPTGQVGISFSDFDIESHSFCNYDSVTVSRKPSLVVYQTQNVAAGVLGLVSQTILSLCVVSRLQVKLMAMATLRSEERRVGKECRTRWSPDH